ncbi:thiol peroxidase [Erysipelothrix sp. P66]|uniref:thiol peroxidase n=1 Tax=Erysipelothrix sp. P66 TaxID=3141531 RepID=UPI00315DAAB7
MEITKKGVPTALAGSQPVVGEKAPTFKLKNLEDVYVGTDTLTGNVVLLSVFPDINTRICDLQTRHFFQVASELDDVTIVNISNNTKEEFASWCATNGIDSEMLRDEDHAFADAYGIWIPEFEVLARSIFVIDRKGMLVYSEIVPEMAQEPNYEAAIAAAKNI